MRRLLVSEVISSFKEALNFSKKTFRSWEILALTVRQCLRPAPRNKDFLLLLVKLDLHLHFRCSPVGCFSSFGFL